MPQGDPALEPQIPIFPSGSQVGTPDLVLSFSEAYIHEGDLTDQYQIIVLPSGLTEDRMIKSIELRPGNNRIVHHALFAIDSTGQASQMDAATPEYGYEGFGGFGVEPQLDQFPQAYVPGAKPILFHDGLGARMPAGSDLLIQMHYAPVPVSESDSSTVNIFFADEDETIDRIVQQYIMLPFGPIIQNGPFIIQPETVKTFHGKLTLPFKASLFGVFPHMHLLGKDWEVFAIHPNGDTTNIISIPEWDFNWQNSYYFDHFEVLEIGTEIHAYASYDNTSDNPFNPNVPPKFVFWGEGTTDEMYYLPLIYVPYKEGDEDVVFDETVVTDTEELIVEDKHNSFLDPVPNPAGEMVNLQFTIAQNQPLSIDFVNAKGQVVKSVLNRAPFIAGQHQMSVPIADLPDGLYFITIGNERLKLTKKLMVSSALKINKIVSFGFFCFISALFVAYIAKAMLAPHASI